MNLITLKVAELRKMAEGRKIKGWEDMKRADLIKALSVKKEVKEDKPKLEEAKVISEEVIEEEVKEEPVIEDSIGIKGDRTPTGSKAEKMKAQLAGQPKISICVPLDPGEKIGSTKSVCLNGYRLNIKKGVYVSVPQQVADVIAKSTNQILNADNIKGQSSGQPIRIEGNNLGSELR